MGARLAERFRDILLKFAQPNQWLTATQMGVDVALCRELARVGLLWGQGAYKDPAWTITELGRAVLTEERQV